MSDENVFEVLLAADHLQVTSVVQQCCKYLETEVVELSFDMQTYCGRTQNAEPYSMEYPMEYLKWSTPKNHVLVK